MRHDFHLPAGTVKSPRAGSPGVSLRVVLLALGCALSIAGPAAAADLPAIPAPAPVPAAGAWRYQATVYGWATSLNGDVGIRDLPTAPVDVSFIDLLKNLDGALMGSFFASNGEWVILADLVWAKLSQGTSVSAAGGIDFDVGMRQTIASAAIGHMLPSMNPDLDVAATLGVRYQRIKTDVSATSLAAPVTASLDDTQSWADPTVGLTMHWALNESWFVNGVIDVGGFGVGSKFTSQGYLGVGYWWTKSLTSAVGYRYLYTDYEASGSDSGFRYQTTMHGPTVSLAWHF